MNLGFLDVLSQPAQKHREQVGTAGTSSVHPSSSVPSIGSAAGNAGNNMLISTAVNGDRSQVFPICSQFPETERPNVYKAVPTVPSVPNMDERVCIADTDSLDDRESTAVQLSRWVGARCVRSQHVWGSEKSLYRDYAAWWQKHNQAPCFRDLFCAVMNERFRRELDGWQGLCLSVDFAASKGIGRKKVQVLPSATARIQ